MRHEVYWVIPIRLYFTVQTIEFQNGVVMIGESGIPTQALDSSGQVCCLSQFGFGRARRINGEMSSWGYHSPQCDKTCSYKVVLRKKSPDFVV